MVTPLNIGIYEIGRTEVQWAFVYHLTASIGRPYQKSNIVVATNKKL